MPFFVLLFMFNREITNALFYSRPCGGEGWGLKKLEAVSNINETFKRHINKVGRLRGLAVLNIYISTFK